MLFINTINILTNLISGLDKETIIGLITFYMGFTSFIGLRIDRLVSLFSDPPSEGPGDPGHGPEWR